MLKESEFQALFDRVQRSTWPSHPALGALGFLTHDATLRAVATVRTGRVVACANAEAGRHVVEDGEGEGLVTSVDSAGRWAAVNERLSCDLHGPAAQTHLDALGHFFYDGRGFAGSTPLNVTESGVRDNDVLPASAGIVGRGLLLDLPRIIDAPYVPADQPVPHAEVVRWLDKAETLPEPGDLLFVRTGRPQSPTVSPGEFREVASLDLDCAAWINHSRFSIVVSDAGMDSPVPVVEGVPTPWHILLLISMGIWLVDSADLDELARACQEEQRTDFLAMLGPMPLPGATASPVNPVAVL